MKKFENSSEIHTTTLEFAEESTEKRYLINTLPFNLRTFRIICVIAFSIHAVYSIKDFFWAYNNIVLIRVFVIMPFFVLAYILSKSSFIAKEVRNFYKLANIIVLITVILHLLFAWRNPYVYTQITHTIPLIIYGTYIFVGVKFKHLLYFLGPITFTLPLLFTWYLMEYTLGQKIDVTIFLTINYFIATFAKYNLELFHRNQFSKRVIQQTQQSLIVTYNKELRHQKELYRGLTERSDDVITIRAMDGTLDFVSKSVEEMLGYKPEELIGKQTDFLIYPDDLQTMNGEFMKRLGEGDHPQFEYRMIHKSGKIVWVQSVRIPIMDENNNLIGMQGSARDISYKKEIELKLKESKKRLEDVNTQKDRFFSIISHDLRGPFDNVVALSNMLSDGITSYSKEELTQLAHHLEQASSSSKELLENLLTWSKTQLNGAVINKSSINLNEAASVNVYLLTQIALQKQITLVVDLDTKLMIHADVEMIKTVIRNLMSNAIKYSHKGEMVKVYTRNKTDNTIEIVVEDSGIGISKDRITNVFNLDSKETTLGTNNETGTGLGLIICKDFVELNGGEIGIESQVDVGTKIFFSIPLANLD